MATDEVLDAVIVGAGISGLAAAHKLVSSEVRQLVVLEAKGCCSVCIRGYMSPPFRTELDRLKSLGRSDVKSSFVKRGWGSTRSFESV